MSKEQIFSFFVRAGVLAVSVFLLLAGLFHLATRVFPASQDSLGVVGLTSVGLALLSGAVASLGCLVVSVAGMLDRGLDD